MLENNLLAIVLPFVNAGEYFVGYCLVLEKAGNILLVSDL